MWLSGDHALNAGTGASNIRRGIDRRQAVQAAANGDANQERSPNDMSLP